MDNHEDSGNGCDDVGDDNNTTREACPLVCPVMYAEYYSGTDRNILFSSLRTSQAWLNVVRQSNEEMFCESCVWTDFKMTTESVFFATESDSPTPGHLPPEIRGSIRRYFYEKFCKELAVKYGMPTILTFYDNLERGLDLSVDDHNHRYFVDSMLADFRFVAAIKLVSPSCDAQATGQVNNNRDANEVERNKVSDERYARRVANSSRSVDSMDEFVHDDDGYMYDDDDVLAFRDKTLPRLLETPVPTVTVDLSETEMGSVLNEYELELKRNSQPISSPVADTTISVPPLQQLPQELYTQNRPESNTVHTGVNETAEKISLPPLPQQPQQFQMYNSPDEIMDVAPIPQEYHMYNSPEAMEVAPIIFAEDLLDPDNATSDRKPVGLRENNSQIHNIPTSQYPVGPVGESGIFKRPHPANPQRREWRFRELDGRPSKENTDTSESEDDRRVISDSSTESEIGRRTGAIPRYRHRSRQHNNHFEILNVRLTHENADTIDTKNVYPGSVVFIYSFKRKSNSTILLVREFTFAAENIPPIDMTTMTWPVTDLVERLRDDLGEKIVLSRRQTGDNPIQIRNVDTAKIFQMKIPNVMVTLQRTPVNVPLRL